MNGRLLKEVKAGKEVVIQLKAAAKAAADQHRRDSEAAERKEERMGQMCNALKAAERAKAAEQEAWAAKEIEWAKEKANLLEAYEKCRQGLERAVRKLKEEKEKQVALEDQRRAARIKRKAQGRHPLCPNRAGNLTGALPLPEPERLTPSPPGGQPPGAAPASVGACQGRPPRPGREAEQPHPDGRRRDGGGRG